MRHTIQIWATITALCAVSLVALFTTPEASAFSGGIQDGVTAARGADQPADLFGGSDSIFTKITNVLLFIIGAISVIMIIIGGIRYVVSGGNSASVTAAKNTILYAVVGIIVAILAFALVNFVVGSFTTGGGTGGTNV